MGPIRRTCFDPPTDRTTEDPAAVGGSKHSHEAEADGLLG
jgi:hypothetical protein